jgi:hypothetical protein
MEKLYVNEIGPNGDVSTVGLFYSRAEADKIVAMLSDIPERSARRYEIVPAVRHLLTEKMTEKSVNHGADRARGSDGGRP